MGSIAAVLTLMSVFGVLLHFHEKGRWPRSSAGGAITGFTGIATSFGIVGACIDTALDKPEWLQAPGALWSAILTACGMFIWGALLAGPWFATRMLDEARRDHPVGRD